MSSLPPSGPAPAVTETGSSPAGRVIWQIGGSDAYSFLQGLISNDILALEKAPGIRWAALLNPQGKYLADFFLFRRDCDEKLHLDIDNRLAPAVLRLLQLYKLRANVTIAPSDLQLIQRLAPPGEGEFADPRHPALGTRRYEAGPGEGPDPALWEALRIEYMVPEYPHELRVNESYILEQGFERLNGVDFRKGCYVGQEVTARMKHKTDLRKGLVRLSLSGDALPGTPVLLEDGREAGVLGTVREGRALAFMRFDRLDQPLTAGGIAVVGESPRTQP